MTQFGYMPDTHGGPYDQPEPSPERSADFAAQLLDEAEWAEQGRFDGVFVPERHARTECMFPSPLSLLAAIAARTHRVKIGTDIIMPPLYNPVHLAQSAALIDLLSRGRLILGLGVGYHPAYFAHFGIPLKQREGRFEESLEVMNKAWTTDHPFAHHGKYYHFDAIHLTPKPYQRPRPPIWIGAFGPKSIARVGRLADAWSAAPFFDSVESIKAQVSIYQEAAVKAGKKPCIVLLRDGWLASSREEAERIFGRLWLEEAKFYFRWGMLAPTGDFRSESDFTLEKIRPNRYPIMGNAADWLEALDYWDRSLGGIDWFILRVRLPMGPSKAAVRECISHLGEEVLPRYRGEA
jgi:alkanesulfonate monooxygenase SsuD/methylene tetrahydromethanopterin reductase-like flavin-dependent oxidoreductase (luciferase family)